MERVSPQIRIVAIMLVLVGLAGFMALRMLGPSATANETALPVPAHAKAKAKPHPVKAAAKAKPAAAEAARAKAARVKAARVKAARDKAARARAAAAKPKPPLNAPVPATGFPKAVDRALADHEVVVVSLIVRGARVDTLAAAEAQAGAKLGGVGYLALNVLNEDVARALMKKLDRVEDPSVLVIKRSGEIALQLNGFVDRETVAQAAANASS